jgi:site-specific recombinase XerC
MPCYHIFSDIDHHVAHLIANGVSHNTKKTYTTGVRRYLKFCMQMGLDPFHPSESTWLRFIGLMSVQGLLVRTITTYLSGVRTWLVSIGLPEPGVYTPRVSLMIKGMNRTHPEPRRAAPITHEMLLYLVNSLPKNYDNLVTLSALFIIYFGCLRSSELCLDLDSPPLRRAHFKFYLTKPKSFRLHVPSSKTTHMGLT